MSYEKQTWVTGETITEEKLNHMEDGIGGVYTITMNHILPEGETTISYTYNGVLIVGGIPLYLSSDYVYNHPLSKTDSITFPVIGDLYLEASYFSGQTDNGTVILASATVDGDIETIMSDEYISAFLVTGDGTINITWQWSD